MKISDVLKELWDIQEKHGDIDVRFLVEQTSGELKKVIVEEIWYAEKAVPGIASPSAILGSKEAWLK